MQKNYVQEILNIIHGNIPQAELAEKLSDYHEKRSGGCFGSAHACRTQVALSHFGSMTKWLRSSPIWTMQSRI